MKKLLCVTCGMKAGGAETFLMKLLRSIDKTRIQMDFCCATKEKCVYDDEIRELGSNIHNITMKTIDVKLYKKEYLDFLKNNKYDAVMRTCDTCFSFYDLWLAKKMGTKTLVCRSCNSNAQISKLQMIVHKLLRGVLSTMIDVKIAPSTEAAKFTFGARAVRKNKVHILHNGLEYDKFKFTEQGRNTVRTEFDIADKYVIGHIGRFNKQKNHLFLLDIFNEIQKERENAVLLLIGTGEEMPAVKNKAAELGISDKVIFAGLRPDIGNILSAMDIFVFPSLFEGMPNTVIEAQASGLPCLISDTITKEADITGLVTYTPLTHDAKDWAKQAIDISNACNTRKDTSEDFIREKYDIKSVTDEFTRLVFGE